jgi:hypothetical protein
MHKLGRYCSRTCRAAALKARRAAARAELVEALGELRGIEQRVEQALRVLGLGGPVSLVARRQDSL